MELIKDNYIRGSGSGDTWHVDIDPPKRKVGTYFQETLLAMEHVNDVRNGEIQLLYSGGLDSEYVARVLLHLGIKFTPVIIQLKNVKENSIYNDHDTAYAFDFCKSHNLTPTIYDLDFDKFVSSGQWRTIAESVECCAIAVPATLYVASQLDGFTILGNDPPYLRYEKETDKWYLEELQYIHSILRYYKKFNLNGCPFLLSYTPEMMLAFLLDPKIVALGNNMFPGKKGSNSTKSYVFNNGSGFNMDVYDFDKKTRIKYTGYEKIYRSDILKHPNIGDLKSYTQKWNGEYLEPYQNAVTRLSIHQ
jgi:hypothetical protein